MFVVSVVFENGDLLHYARMICYRAYNLPYVFLSSFLFQVPIILFGLMEGGLAYVLISAAVFCAHLLARRLSKNRFDYPLEIGEKRFFGKEILTNLLLSLVLGTWGFLYFGGVRSELLRVFEDSIYNIFASMVGFFVFASAFLFVFFFVLSLVQRVTDAIPETKNRGVYGVFIAVVFSLGFVIAILLLFGDFEFDAFFENPLYVSLVKLVFGAPALWLVKMLFLGFTHEEYMRTFSVSSKAEKYF